ncbi:unnamed protein product [Orchesella dallaii]|uniref:Uncharacterized protein n=1 Tax=Orchesella dallaii TaxID=48710 RepID=A0ABP1SA39_9HEXA
MISQKETPDVKETRQFTSGVNSGGTGRGKGKNGRLFPPTERQPVPQCRQVESHWLAEVPSLKRIRVVYRSLGSLFGIPKGLVASLNELSYQPHYLLRRPGTMRKSGEDHHQGRVRGAVKE